MQQLIQIAASEIGTTEVPGQDANPRILAFAQTAGFGSWYTSDETPWCSVFLNFVAAEAGAQRSHDGRAASWESIGEAVTVPWPGDVVLLVASEGTERITHVGLFTGYSQDLRQVFVLGGNQSNTVNIAPFPVKLVKGFRRLSADGASPADPPSQEPPLAVHTLSVPLRRGDKGPAVLALQQALRGAGFDCGVPDGDFGPKTEAAIRSLQASVAGLAMTGVFDAPTRDALAHRHTV